MGALQQFDSISDPKSPLHANSSAVLRQAAKAIGLTTEQLTNTLHQITDDPYVQFLTYSYGN